MSTDLSTMYFPDNINIIFKTYRLGIYKQEVNLSIKYYLFDVLILFFTVSHIICLMLQGLYLKNETEIESVFEACLRIITNTDSLDRSKTTRRRPQNQLNLQNQESLEEDIEFDEVDNLVALLKDSELRSMWRKNQNELKIKQGYDMYYYIAISQYFILIYTILFFTSVERNYSNMAPENYTFQQFSASTVIIVF